MTELLAPYADAVFITRLASVFTSATVAKRVPADLAGAVPFIQVVRFGGPMRTTLDDPTFDVDCYDADEVSAMQLAREVQRELLTYSRGVTVVYGSEKAVICNVTCISGPSWRPYDNTNVERVGATYTATLQAAR